jgi:hypothetical protein
MDGGMKGGMDGGGWGGRKKDLQQNMRLLKLSLFHDLSCQVRAVRRMDGWTDGRREGGWWWW